MHYPTNNGTPSSAIKRKHSHFDRSSSSTIYEKSPTQLYPMTATAMPSSSKKPFVSAQRRYDNVRVRDSEFHTRVCLECGAVLTGAEKDYQEHLLVHESVNLLYQLDCFERFGVAKPTAAMNATKIGTVRRVGETAKKIVGPNISKQRQLQHVSVRSMPAR
ncbi:hypothetical protein niasHT_013174 [Heterodera trifolii]|uniref:C2H2-type domain-containing protein n=1 Tax=Heterodera trifolii TaxID=157864 RepID=A0ABD2K6T5_9BILA